MAEIYRKSVMAIRKETTEAVPLLPSAGSNFIALQQGFNTTPSFSKLVNAELKNSVGVSAPIIGVESPKMTIAHYMRHSGVVAAAPQFSPMIESSVGQMVSPGAEILTTSGSTAGSNGVAAVVNLAVGGGASYQRGQAMLVKNGLGYELRPVFSVSGDVATMGFNFNNAPPTGVGLGRAVLFIPNDTPPTLTATVYQGQGAALEVVAGLRVTDMSIDAKAKELLKATFTMDGIFYYFDPISITASNNEIDFNDGSAKTCAIAIKLYKDPNDLAQAVQDAMNGVSSGITVTYNNSGANAGKFTIVKASGTLVLDFLSGANTANTIAPAIGFSVTDHSGFLTYTSDSVMVWSSAITPSFDAGQPLVVKDNEVLIGDAWSTANAGAQEVKIKCTSKVTKVDDIGSTSGQSGSIIQERSVSVDVVLTLARHNADPFRRFYQGQTTQFLYNFGTKSGGNWQPGFCGQVYMPQAKITAYALKEVGGVITIDMSLEAFVDNTGKGEFYLNFI